MEKGGGGWGSSSTKSTQKIIEKVSSGRSTLFTGGPMDLEKVGQKGRKRRIVTVLALHLPAGSVEREGAEIIK